MPGHRTKDDKTRRVAALVPALAAFAVSALLIVAMVGIGPVRIVAPDWQDFDIEPRPMPERTGPSFDEQEADEEERPAGDLFPDIDIPWQAALAVLLVLIVAAAAIILRKLPWELRRRNRSHIVGGDLDTLSDHSDELRAAAETASAALRRGETAGADAVIQAWLALEAAAAASGLPREQSQTPTEFTADLLLRHHADERATTRLRDLYHRARFAPNPAMSTEDVGTAQTALTTILATLETPQPDISQPGTSQPGTGQPAPYDRRAPS